MRDPHVVKSAARVFEVVELFEAERRPLSAVQVERALNYPPSSALALLKSMVALGYIAYDRISRTYFPTMRVQLMGSWLETSLYGEGNLSELLEELAASTGETIALSAQNDLDMQFLHIRTGAQPIVLTIRSGSVAPLFRSAIGTAALMERADAEVIRLAERHNRTRPRTDPAVDIPAYLAELARARATGHVVSYQTFVPSIGAVAWPLPTLNGARALVVSVAGPTDRIRANEAQIRALGDAALAAHAAAVRQARAARQV